jgi:hypothetical protein
MINFAAMMVLFAIIIYVAAIFVAMLVDEWRRRHSRFF